MFVLVDFVPSHCCTYSWILCEVERFFFVCQFATVDKLCYWFSLLTGMCTIFTSWWDSCFVIRWLERLTVIIRWSLTVVCRCWVVRRLQWDSLRTRALQITLRCWHGMILSYGTPVDKVMTLMCVRNQVYRCVCVCAGYRRPTDGECIQKNIQLHTKSKNKCSNARVQSPQTRT